VRKEYVHGRKGERVKGRNEKIEKE